MTRISVCCSSCGEWIQRMIDPDCPPSHLRCACGTTFALTVECDPVDRLFPDDVDSEGCGSEPPEAAYLGILSARGGVGA